MCIREIYLPVKMVKASSFNRTKARTGVKSSLSYIWKFFIFPTGCVPFKQLLISLLPRSLATTILFFCLCQYLSSGIWFISLSIMTSRFIYTWHMPELGQYSFVWINHISFTFANHFNYYMFVRLAPKISQHCLCDKL